MIGLVTNLFRKRKKYELVFNDKMLPIYSKEDQYKVLPYGTEFLFIDTPRSHINQNSLIEYHRFCSLRISDGTVPIKELPSFRYDTSCLMHCQIRYNETMLIDQFFRKYFKVFDLDGNVKPVGREVCMELISMANRLVKPSSVTFEEGENTGCMNIFGIFTLTSMLADMFYMDRYKTEEEFLLHNNIKSAILRFQKLHNYSNTIKYKNSAYLREIEK